MSTSASDVVAFSPLPRRPVCDWRKERCIDRVFFARFQQSGMFLEMYRLSRSTISPKVRISDHWRLQPLMAADAHPSSSSNRPPSPPCAVPHNMVGRTTISKKKKVLDQISCKIQQTEQDIKLLKEALKPAPPGFGRIIGGFMLAVMVVMQTTLLLAYPTLECLIFIGIPFFFVITNFKLFSHMYPPLFRMEGWLQFGDLIGRYVSLALARLGWFYSWLTMKD